MRVKAGSGPRTMSQKVLAAHCEPQPPGDLVDVRVDQIILAREPNAVLGQSVEAGLSHSEVEVSVAYPPHCVAVGPDDVDPGSPYIVPRQAVSLGFLIAEPGTGFASFVHLERFSSPARLALTDEPRLANTGGASMLTLVASAGQIDEALRTGTAKIRQPTSIQILLKGRLRSFVCARDLSLELLRQGLAETVTRVDEQRRAPVVLEFAGPGARFLSVMDRAVLCALAPRVGAAAALFAADEKTEVFLRDQKRSKAQRGLNADSGAPFDEVITVDLAVVDPLAMDEAGRVRAVREFEGQEVGQVLLGGDSGTSLRDLLTVASLLKSKRVTPGVEFLLCAPSRQILEVLARTDALVDLIATGARVIEPDRRALSGLLYPPRPGGLALRNSDPENTEKAAPGLVVSPDTLAYAVAHGTVGDPRSFKRPARVTVPRNLPTDDVLIARGAVARGGAKGKGRVDKKALRTSEPPPGVRSSHPPAPKNWQHPTVLSLISDRMPTDRPSAFLAACPEDVQWVAENCSIHPQLRAVIAHHIPAATVSVLSGNGILALEADLATLEQLGHNDTVGIPDSKTWNSDYLELECDGRSSAARVQWLAVGAERKWTAEPA